MSVNSAKRRRLNRWGTTSVMKRAAGGQSATQPTTTMPWEMPWARTSSLERSIHVDTRIDGEPEDESQAQRDLLLARERVDVSQPARGQAQAGADRGAHRLLVGGRPIGLGRVDRQRGRIALAHPLPLVERAQRASPGDRALGHRARVKLPEELVDRGQPNGELAPGRLLLRLLLPGAATPHRGVSSRRGPPSPA